MINQTGGVQVERLDAIRSHLYARGFSSIQDLADAVGASLATIRRDLRILEGEGAIDRVHGGARIAEGSSVEMAFQERMKRNLDAKRAISAAAYELLVPHASVFLNVPSLEVSLLGGQLRSENASMVGPQAEAMLDTLWFDQLFLGASAIGPDGAIYSVDSAEANLNKRMLTRAGQRFVLADSSKFGTMATYRVGPLSDCRVVTDTSLKSNWRRMLSEMRVELTAAAVAPSGKAAATARR